MGENLRFCPVLRCVLITSGEHGSCATQLFRLSQFYNGDKLSTIVRHPCSAGPCFEKTSGESRPGLFDLSELAGWSRMRSVDMRARRGGKVTGGNPDSAPFSQLSTAFAVSSPTHECRISQTCSEDTDV